MLKNIVEGCHRVESHQGEDGVRMTQKSYKEGDRLLSSDGYCTRVISVRHCFIDEELYSGAKDGA